MHTFYWKFVKVCLHSVWRNFFEKNLQFCTQKNRESLFTFKLHNAELLSFWRNFFLKKYSIFLYISEKNHKKSVKVCLHLSYAVQTETSYLHFDDFFFKRKFQKFFGTFHYIDYYFAHLLKFQMQYRPYGLSKSFLLEVTNGFYKDALHVAAIAILYKIPPLLRRTDDDFHSLLYVHLQS